MSKGLLPVLAVCTVSSLVYAIKKYITDDASILERSRLIEIIIAVRKGMFSTLREIAYVSNCLRIMDSGLQPKKIKQITMKDGACAQEKLQAIQGLVLSRFGVTKQTFERSCHHHSHNDVEVKLLLQNFKVDIQNAIDGTIESYHGHLPKISSADTIRIHREITLRRMETIRARFLEGRENLQCLRQQSQIEQYLQGEGISHGKQANEKVFISVLEYHYKTNSEFQRELHELEKEYEDFIEQVKTQRRK